MHEREGEGEGLSKSREKGGLVTKQPGAAVLVRQCTRTLRLSNV